MLIVIPSTTTKRISQKYNKRMVRRYTRKYLTGKKLVIMGECKNQKKTHRKQRIAGINLISPVIIIKCKYIKHSNSKIFSRMNVFKT
jgi:disulfide oxidoreductase YuzD